MSFFGHFKDGNVHLNLAGIEGSDVSALIECLNEEVVRYGGGLSAEHGLGKSKLRSIASYLNKEQSEFQSYLQSYFDADRLFSRGY